MFRSLSSVRPLVRAYSDAPLAKPKLELDINALLERVKNATAKKQERPSNASKMLNNGKRRNNQRPREAGQQRQQQRQQTPGQPDQLDAPASEGKLFNKPRVSQRTFKNDSELSDAFTEISSSIQPSQQFQKRYTNNNNNQSNNRGPRNINNNNTSFKSNRPPQTFSSNPRSRSQSNSNKNSSQRRTPNKNSNNRTARKPTDVSGTLVNHNFDVISTSYIPEIPSISSIIESNHQLTSQTSTSRIIRAYQSIQENPDADVSALLTGKTSSSILTNEVIQKMKTDNLKLNATSVINSLNNNPSVAFEDKVRLVGPLVGLEPVKALSS